VVAAARNYRLTVPDDASALHEVSSPSDVNCKIGHTCQFRYHKVSTAKFYLPELAELERYITCLCNMKHLFSEIYKSSFV
jgi:hypothetical protein